MSSSRLSTNGQLVIPARFRKALNLRPGDKVEMELEDRGLVLRRESERAAKAQARKVRAASARGGSGGTANDDRGRDWSLTGSANGRGAVDTPW